MEEVHPHHGENGEEIKDAEMIDQSIDEQELVDQVENKGIQVLEPVDVLSGQEAYFALLAKEMLSLAGKYKKDVHLIHKLMFGHSCNYESLIKHLENPSDVKFQPWEPLEDLALKESKDADAFKYVVAKRRVEEIAERKRFLEI